MVAALTLLLAAQTPAPDPLEAIVARSNRLWYGLRDVTTVLEIRTGGGERNLDGTPASEPDYRVREVRQGGKIHFSIRRQDAILFDGYNDRRREIALAPGKREYSDLPSGRRATYAEATRTPLPVLEGDRFDFRFETTHGLVLRSSPPLKITKTEPAVRVGRETFRRLTLRAAKLNDDGTADGDYVEMILHVERDGLIRRAQAQGFDEDGVAAPLTASWTCDPVAPKGEPFHYDVRTLAGWQKVDKISIAI